MVNYSNIETPLDQIKWTLEPEDLPRLLRRYANDVRRLEMDYEIHNYLDYQQSLELNYAKMVLALVHEKMGMRYTPDEIMSLAENEIVVFGSNTQGRHGAGLAKVCLDRYGAIYGQSSGLQGNSYAIVTKDLAKGKQSVPLGHIQRQIDELYGFARQHPEKIFLLTKIGCGLGGYSVKDVAGLVKQLNYPPPDNVILPREFHY